MLMVFHHAFGFAGSYVEVPAYLSDAHLHSLALAAKICVPTFAFLTGWFYYHHQDKSIVYSAKKIVSFMLSYWMVVAAISLFACIFCGYRYSSAIFGEMFPVLPHKLMLFAWYAWFYVLMMAAFPIFGLLEKHPLTFSSSALFVVLVTVTMIISWKVGWVHDLCTWFPAAASGYLIAKFRVFEFCLSRVRPGMVAFGVSALLMVAARYAFYYDYRAMEYNTGFLAAPLFVLGALFCGSLLRKAPVSAVLCFIGRHSMNIWFFHCLFYSVVTRAVVQKMVFFLTHPVWIYSVVLLGSLALSILITPAQKWVIKRLLPPIWAKLGL